MRKWKQKYKFYTVMIIIVALLLSLLFYVRALKTPPKTVSSTESEPEFEIYGSDLPGLLNFGLKDAFYTYTGPVTNRTWIGQHFAVAEEKRFSTTPKVPIEIGEWYSKLYIYNIDRKDFQKKEVELFALIDEWNSDYYPRLLKGWMKGKDTDYLIIILWRKDRRKFYSPEYNYRMATEGEKTILLNLTDLKISEVDDDFTTNYPDSLVLRQFYFTNIPKLAADNGIEFKDVTQFEINLEKFPLSRNRINFSKEITGLSYDKGTKTLPVTIKVDRISDEELFQEMRRLLAPEGKEAVAVVATDPTTGVQTPIYSAADYQAWKEAHPHLFKGSLSFINDVLGRTKEKPALGKVNPKNKN